MGTKVTKRLKELSETGDIPDVFRDIKTRLPLILSIVARTQHETQHLSLEAEKALKEVVRQCFEQASQLHEILKRVVIAHGDSRLKKTVKATLSLVEEKRLQRIAAGLRDNVQLLTSLSVTPVEKVKSTPASGRRPSVPLTSYTSASGLFVVPFTRDEYFVGRASNLQSIAASFETQCRVALAGMGGVGKSQIAIEYCYRYKDSKPGAHVFWVYGGTIARFYKGYKRIAQQLNLPGWDDPEVSILILVSSWLSSTQDDYLLVVDNADNIEHWWPGKYKSGASLDDPSKDLSKYLPDRMEASHLLITTRDNRVSSRLARIGKPIPVQPMSEGEASALFLSKLGDERLNVNQAEVHTLLDELDHLPLAVSQAAAFIQENGVSITEYTRALHGKEAEEFLDEELDDVRRDEDSINSVHRTLKLSYDQIKQQKPRAADLLCLLAMLDRQSIPKTLLRQIAEVTTSLGTLQSFNLVTSRAGMQSFQMHRLVQSFARISVQRDNAAHKWQEKALACVSRDYPTEIGVGQWPECDALAPHVHIVAGYHYKTTEARLDLAHLLCWAADFDIERGMYTQALERAKLSLEIFRELVSDDDERLAAATWLYGRLRYYHAQRANDADEAAGLLEKALSTAKYPSLTYGETAFELAHLYYDQCNQKRCLEMGKASFECWKDIEGPSSARRHEEEGISMWQEIMERCPASDASDNTKTVFTYRSMAGIAEFQGDAAMAEIFYANLVRISETMYYSEHIHVLDYRLSHAEQIMRQGRLEEATRLGKAILASNSGHSEWRICAGCLQTAAECCRLQASYSEEQEYRIRTLEVHEKNLGRDHKDSVDVIHDLADCYLKNHKYSEAGDLYQEVASWRNAELGSTHVDTVRAIECLGVCHAQQGRNDEAVAAYLAAVDRQSRPNARLLHNLCVALQHQGKWEMVETWARQLYDLDEGDWYRHRALWSLIEALEQQDRTSEALEMRVSFLAFGTHSAESRKGWRLPQSPPVRVDRRFGRLIHPRTWSA
ncbi:MAG: hypothetical protein LQ339_000138 [Xanthoria mediterranea]|nr:MAG: hypothetical protein LQ339_000138 [Xanthoria mediterranea]